MPFLEFRRVLDRKSTRLNSSHTLISYAVFCLKKTTRRPGEHHHRCDAGFCVNSRARPAAPTTRISASARHGITAGLVFLTPQGFFFFKGCGDHRVLLSFPPRGPSD